MGKFKCYSIVNSNMKLDFKKGPRGQHAPLIGGCTIAPDPEADWPHGVPVPIVFDRRWILPDKPTKEEMDTCNRMMGHIAGFLRGILLRSGHEDIHEGTRRFDVNVCRTAYGFLTITVEAASPEEAEGKALEEAGNHEFLESSSEYSVEGTLLHEGD